MARKENVQQQEANDAATELETSPSLRTHPTLDERKALGKSLREKCPRQSHAAWQPPNTRRDPLDLLTESNQGRIAELVPIRHGRMLHSPFAFFRGAALHMAADLAGTPTSGLQVQACGDCHLLNFGAFATPERRIIFDINDLDETAVAPFEWDVKRLATSIVLACRQSQFDAETARTCALACCEAYRTWMGEYSDLPVLDVWYASIDIEDYLPEIRDATSRSRLEKRLAKARERSVLEHDFPELVTTAGFAPTIKENPPLIYHWREKRFEEALASATRAFDMYRATLPPDRRSLLDRFKLVDLAIKVVGVGSVGTFCGIMLLMAGEHDPLFLQFKQARRSVLEPFVGPSPFRNQGERIVHGYRMMQSASDLFLGWTDGADGREFYVRQLRDMKIKPLVELFTADVMEQYAELCGRTLAHAHARSSDPAQIYGYLGKSDKFDEAIADFAIAYADQTEQDFEVLRAAAQAGKLEVFVEEE